MCFRFFLLPPPFLNFFVFSTLLPSWIITFLFHIFQGTYNKKPQFGFMLSLFVILEHFKVLFTSSTELSYWVLLVVPFCSSISVYDWVIWNTKSTYQEIYDKSNFLTPSVSVRVRYPSQHHPLNSHLFILTFLSQYWSIMHTKQGLSDGRWNNTPPLIHLTPRDDVWCVPVSPPGPGLLCSSWSASSCWPPSAVCWRFWSRGTQSGSGGWRRILNI